MTPEERSRRSGLSMLAVRYALEKNLIGPQIGADDLRRCKIAWAIDEGVARPEKSLCLMRTAHPKVLPEAFEMELPGPAAVLLLASIRGCRAGLDVLSVPDAREEGAPPRLKTRPRKPASPPPRPEEWTTIRIDDMAAAFESVNAARRRIGIKHEMLVRLSRWSLLPGVRPLEGGVWFLPSENVRRLMIAGALREHAAPTNTITALSEAHPETPPEAFAATVPAKGKRRLEIEVEGREIRYAIAEG